MFPQASIVFEWQTGIPSGSVFVLRGLPVGTRDAVLNGTILGKTHEQVTESIHAINHRRESLGLLPIFVKRN